MKGGVAQMNDQTKRLVLMATGLLLTMMAIVIYLNSFSSLEKAIDGVNNKQKQDQHAIEMSSLTRFDNCTIYGSQVISYLKKNWDSFETIQLDIGEGTITVPDKDTFNNNCRQIGSDYYIYGNGTYYVDLIYNKNEVPTENQMHNTPIHNMENITITRARTLFLSTS